MLNTKAQGHHWRPRPPRSLLALFCYRNSRLFVAFLLCLAVVIRAPPQQQQQQYKSAGACASTGCSSVILRARAAAAAAAAAAAGAAADFMSAVAAVAISAAPSAGVSVVSGRTASACTGGAMRRPPVLSCRRFRCWTAFAAFGGGARLLLLLLARPLNFADSVIQPLSHLRRWGGRCGGRRSACRTVMASSCSAREERMALVRRLSACPAHTKTQNN